ncbi:HRDC domain-containing protein [Corynebacterium timonense]|uniref:Ribonuclease D n=1 Tax=Corynebacterium timonense TaxID=441500 RepID=A0A1H1NIH9_9CORY|nr:HRDC domain-containing protein [Corynebacterium timonense]SDR98129.1 ribonuclease D [Corynebacterium timonense]
MPAFELVADPHAYRRAASALARGRGPFAIDTERASAYRYDDRAFLVQVFRRDAGTFLIAPEGHREAVRDIFSPVLGGGEWILHAAGEDLPSLAALGLFPGSLFDTELAGRLGGFSHPNLAAMVERFLGVTLEKGHGREDWSTVPLPRSWQEYAALDVAYLNELAEAQAEYLDARGFLGFAEQEFADLVRRHRARPAPAPKTWRDIKGVTALRSPAQLQVAKHLWRARDAHARDTDTAPGRVLPNRLLVELARTQPRSAAETAHTSGFPRRRRGAAEAWSRVIRDALDADPATWPERARPASDGAPGKRAWQQFYPESWEALNAARDAISEVAATLGTEPDTLLQPAVAREVVWATHRGGGADTHAVALELSRQGARSWQVELTAAALAGALRS